MNPFRVIFALNELVQATRFNMLLFLRFCKFRNHRIDYEIRKGGNKCKKLQNNNIIELI